MANNVSLNIQLSLIYAADGRPLLGLSITAQIPNTQPGSTVSKLPYWIPSSPTITKNLLELLPISLEADFTHPVPEVELEAEDGTAFLQFVDKSHQKLADAFCAVVETANEGVTYCAPLLCEQGEGGTYFLHNAQGSKIAVFKPADEDPQAVNNPKKKPNPDNPGSPLVFRKTIPKGEAALREVAAYEFDRGSIGVPQTRMMKAKGSFFKTNTSPDGGPDKVGSMQVFVTSECESWDLAPYKFSTTDVHRIGIFDVRSFNTDRHGGNMLAVAREDPKPGDSLYDLVPIDHGFCFPTGLSEANWEWLYWPQAKKPFDEETLAFIASIDLDEDSKLLRNLGLSEEAVRVNQMTTTLLKQGAAAGLTLFEIAKLCQRKIFKDGEEPSPLENACEAAERAAADDPSSFWSHFELAIRGLLTRRAVPSPSS